MPNLIGNYPILQRRRSGLFSLDVALGHRANLGLPMRTLYEIYGHTGSGKSTLSYYLLGKLNDTSDSVICDLENLDVEYLNSAIGISGYDKDVRLVDAVDEKGKARPHEDMLTDMVVRLSKGAGACILDSVGAIQPLAEAKGDFGEAFMGKRAKLVAQVSRALSNIVRNSPHISNAYVINHVHQIIGGHGHVTAGGETLKYMSGVRMMMWQSEIFWNDSEAKDYPIGFVTSGKTEKLRFGAKGQKFQFYIVPGYGVHAGVTALMDCVELGLVERSTTLKLNGKSLGYLKKDFLDYAHQGKTRKFDVFIETLQEYESGLKWDTEPELEREEENVPVSDPKPRKGKSRKATVHTDAEEGGAM